MGGVIITLFFILVGILFLGATFLYAHDRPPSFQVNGWHLVPNGTNVGVEFNISMKNPSGFRVMIFEEVECSLKAMSKVLATSTKDPIRMAKNSNKTEGVYFKLSKASLPQKVNFEIKMVFVVSVKGFEFDHKPTNITCLDIPLQQEMAPPIQCEPPERIYS